MTPLESGVAANPQNDCISQSNASQPIHAQPMHTDGSVRAQSMLERATDSPVLQTARMKPDLEARFVTLFRDAVPSMPVRKSWRTSGPCAICGNMKLQPAGGSGC